MTIPLEVNVAGIDYKVQYQEGMIKSHNLMGQVLYAESTIDIDSSMSDSKKEQVFVHELLHAMLNEAGYDEQDEELVNRLAIVLYQVLKQNDLNFKS
ncbi:ImmA/IrrE family metallo-endopeptidase [Lysinibacillus sp.]|uniref:ImmA/IrrE family metallo-endopeptidase n=1 Tax=Lysinibacillus sp. TaxID=1869345 RepID=UPI00289F8808|nr:ImmA/IrrE family metallo-endopeptidase [Lysinibacillus sp.]